MFDESHDMKLFNTGLEYAGYIDLTETFADQQTIIGQYFDESGIMMLILRAHWMAW